MIRQGDKGVQGEGSGRDERHRVTRPDTVDQRFDDAAGDERGDRSDREACHGSRQGPAQNARHDRAPVRAERQTNGNLPYTLADGLRHEAVPSVIVSARSGRMCTVTPNIVAIGLF